MAVQNLSSVTLVFGERISIPRVNGEIVQYEVRDGKVSFFRYDNGEARKVVVGRHNILGGAQYVKFDEIDLGTHYAAGAPKYYDGRGNLKKIGNR